MKTLFLNSAPKHGSYTKFKKRDTETKELNPSDSNISVYLWYCSLKNKVSHICLGRVGCMDGNDCNIWVGICSFKRKIYFQAIFVVCCHRRDTYEEEMNNTLYR